MPQLDGDQLHQAHAEQKLEEQFAQAQCDHDFEFVNDSFDHEYGTERIHFERCTKCGLEREADNPSSPEDDR